MSSRSPRRRNRSRSFSKSRSRSYSRSWSRSPGRRKRSYSRSYSRSRSRSRDRYRSRSRSPYRRRSYSPYGRRRRSYTPPPHRRHYRGRSGSNSPMSSRRRHVGNRFNPERNNVIGVFGLSLYTNDKDLRDIFEKYGKINEVQVVYDHQTNRSRGFAFVYYNDVEDAVEAKESCNGIEIDGRKIRVDYSITKRPHTPTPGVYMGKPTHKSSRRSSERDRYDDYDDYDNKRGRY
ncbi:PREDICTED: transformer-2 protein homolog beta-like isoform X2 [Amphimedon queenslandica]|uniref:RRM domain-containing protein n=1 Tax=Amphimedon queenslandica TaxID=400682 RepID=A0A1X7VLX6_AMPQE|nr:PREDICTED: transformer-2 protein homolog beta-like isoform X1 [Amphimedon queenslandica]XP_019864115.1 PREDICTED: transformer-2 protein homolog beta-like isoform X2 [Amphimedon queenslandica]|eukprot:XP_019864113.1 PREDICTED: transformer-2 protein homolog beta-like isoform X1 [Amphimedon queenslandica]